MIEGEGLATHAPLARALELNYCDSKRKIGGCSQSTFAHVSVRELGVRNTRLHKKSKYAKISSFFHEET